MLKSFNDTAFSPNLAVKQLNSKRLFMVGDSLMRYSYLALVYALKFQDKSKDSMEPNPVRETSWKSWFDFYNSTHNMLSPQETQCDCYR